MNFFERQTAVKKQSKRLVLLFAMAVFGIVVAVDFVLLIALGGLKEDANPMAILVMSTLGVLAVIGCATLFRVSSLRTGGAAVAQQLGQQQPVAGVALGALDVDLRLDDRD